MNKRDNNVSLWFLGLASLLILLHYTKIISPAEKFFFLVSKPFASKFYSLGFSSKNLYRFNVSKNESSGTNIDLEVENRKLAIENSRLKSLEDENKELRGYLNFLNKNKYKYVMTNVISRGQDNSGDGQYVTLDKGRLDGLYEGLGVVDGDGVIAGKIFEVKDNISKVYLVTDKNCKLAVSLQNENKTVGVAEGELGLTVKINFIPQNEKVNKDDIVVTSGLEKNIPRGLIVGKVSQISNPSNEIWQSVTVEPIARLNSLVIVSVLLP